MYQNALSQNQIPINTSHGIQQCAYAHFVTNTKVAEALIVCCICTVILSRALEVEIIFLGKLPKYSMQFFVMAWDNQFFYIF